MNDVNNHNSGNNIVSNTENKTLNNPVNATNNVANDQNKVINLANLLITRGLVSRDQIEIALTEQKTERSKNKSLDSILVSLGFLTETTLSKIISETKGIKNIDLKNTVLDSKIINMVPHEVAIQTKSIPVSAADGIITVATSDIYNIVTIDLLKKYFPKNYKIVATFASEAQILEVIDQYYKYEMSISGILKEIETGKTSIDNSNNEYTNPTVRLVDAFLVDGIKSGASDLHFEPEENFVRLRYRIDGELKQILSFHKDYWPAIVVRVKILSKMNITESRYPQDGRITYNVLGRDIDFRVATHPGIFGENIVMRILDSRKSIVKIEELGFSEKNSALLKNLLLRPEGIIIVTGPTGSGKTTTLYSILNYINTIEKNIMTLEDPVEYQLPMIRQSNIREGSGMGFTDGIKSLLRQDPDVIFLGEVRDMETANMAIRAAMTGHQVFSTLHTNDAVGAITRLKDIGVSSSLMSGSIICIIAQRLTRKLCNYCKTEYHASEQEKKILGINGSETISLFRKKGCDKCNSGYKGRISINEILKIDTALDELIAKDATRKSIIDLAYKNGFKRMIDDGTDKVLKGIIDIHSLIHTIDMTERLIG